MCRIKDLKPFEHHLCVNDCAHAFVDLPKGAWNKEELCPCCKEPRFKVTKRSGGGELLTPRKVHLLLFSDAYV